MAAVDTWSLAGFRKDSVAIWTCYGLTKEQAEKEARLMLSTGHIKHVEVTHSTKGAGTRSRWKVEKEVWA